MKISQKGFLLGEQTLKIIVAVIAIALLIFLLYSFYSVFTEKNKIEQAEASLSRLIEALGSDNQAESILINPLDWDLLYLKGPLLDCFNEHCLCICKHAYRWWWSWEEECKSLGVCNSILKPVELKSQENAEVENIKINQQTIILKKEGDKYIIKEK